jgi:2-phosphosulfolactate phosphatase
VVARATAQACLLTNVRTVTLVASGDFPEDHACARYIDALINGQQADVQRLLEPLYASERYAKFAQGDWPGFPSTDLELSLTPDRFDFAMPAHRRDSRVLLNTQR